jgi:hypothetical protein
MSISGFPDGMESHEHMRRLAATYGTSSLVGTANIGGSFAPTSVDMYGKRKPVLMSERMCIDNLCGYYGVPKANFDFGSDIMGVGGSFGAGGIGLFEMPGKPDSISVPRFTSSDGKKVSERNFNEDQITDTRYSFDVVVNGPVRSIIRVRTMNWKSGRGSMS